MSTQAGPSSARSSLRGSRRDAARQQQANGGVSERTPLVAGTAPGSGSNRLYNSTTLDPERSPSQVRSKMNVTIASPTPSIRSVSDVYADEYDDEEGEDDGREVEVYVPGKSTSLQTLLNCLGDIIGTGLLAVPIAVAHLGWVLGPTLLILTGLFTLWTLKLILRIIEKDRRMRSFTDIIGFALGSTGERIVTCLFFMEFALWMIALVVLFSDTLAAVWPIYSSDEWKVVCLLITVPTSFVPLRYLSFTSGIGILSTWALVGILVFSGVATKHAPGSLRDPAPTDMWPTHGTSKALVAFSLILACLEAKPKWAGEGADKQFGGHGLIPNLIRDMKRPQDADRVVEMTYAMSMVVYLVIAVCGYLMYGRDVSDEISKDLASTPGFSPLMNTIAVWMVALNPLTKVPLGIRPFSDILFTYLHLHPTILIPESARTPHPTRPPSPSSSSSSIPSLALGAHDPALSSSAEGSHHARERLKYWLRPILRMLIAVLATVGALVMPSFESVMAILGGGFGLVMVVILPVWAGGNVLGWKWYYYPVLVGSGVMAVVGVVVPLSGT